MLDRQQLSTKENVTNDDISPVSDEEWGNRTTTSEIRRFNLQYRSQSPVSDWDEYQMNGILRNEILSDCRLPESSL